MKITINPSRLILEQTDITESNTQANVNAANSDLVLGAVVACPPQKSRARNLKRM